MSGTGLMRVVSGQMSSSIKSDMSGTGLMRVVSGQM